MYERPEESLDSQHEGDPAPMSATAVATRRDAGPRHARLRSRFLADPASADLSGLRPVIAGSWRRSIAWNADPNAQPSVVVPEIDQRVLDSAEAAIRMLLRATREQGGCVVLADRLGTVASIRGSREALAWAEESFARCGASLAEDVAGTNCVGTALEEQRGVMICGTEHLAARLDGVWSASTLVRDPLRRSVRAVLGLIVPLGVIGERDADGFGTLIDRAGAEVVDVLAAKLAAREQALLTAYLRQLRKRGAGAVMAIDGRTTIANHGALELLGAREQLVLAAYAQEAQRTRDVVKRGLTLADGSSITVHIDPVMCGDEPVGSVLNLCATSAVAGGPRATATTQRIDPFEDLLGESPAFARAMELAHRAEERRAAAHIVGEAGTGKRTLALAMAREHGEGALCLDGEVHLSEHDVDRVDAALERNRVVVIVRADLASNAVWRELTTLAERRPSARFILTGRSFDNAALAFVRTIRSLEIEMPPLRARRDDLSALVAKFLGAGPDGPQRVSARLLKALTEAELAGNVAQLREIVTTAATRCSALELTTEDLTAEHRSALMGTTLSPLQIAEAMQIREALREAGGNRVRAAEILRIGRSTLYRRLDMYTRLGFEL